MNTAVLPEGVAPLQPTRAALPGISTSGVNDPAALARQQLPSAVHATPLIAAYNASINPAPKQPSTRAAIAQPSSALAAQVIAQGDALNSDDLAVFAPRTPASPNAREPSSDTDYLADLRIARGEVVTKKATQSAAEQNVARAAVVTKASAEASLQPQRSTMTQLVLGFPGLVTQFLKRPTLSTARGVGAYQLAQARIAAGRKPVDAP